MKNCPLFAVLTQKHEKIIVFLVQAKMCFQKRTSSAYKRKFSYEHWTIKMFGFFLLIYCLSTFLFIKKVASTFETVLLSWLGCFWCTRGRCRLLKIMNAFMGLRMRSGRREGWGCEGGPAAAGRGEELVAPPSK
jgi:hypothetical protein